MEGVLVSAKKEGSTITTTVVSNDKGQFSFPADRLEPGHYNITIRAAGYNLSGPKAVDIGAGAAATADVKLEKAKNAIGQLSNAEWLLSAPGDDQIKVVPARLRRLPHPAAHLHLDARPGRVQGHIHPHGPLRARERARPTCS